MLNDRWWKHIEQWLLGVVGTLIIGGLGFIIIQVLAVIMMISKQDVAKVLYCIIAGIGIPYCVGGLWMLYCDWKANNANNKRHLARSK